MQERTATNVTKRNPFAPAIVPARVGIPADTHRLLTAPEVCEYLRVSRATLYRLLKNHEIPAFRVAKRDWRVAVEDLAQWVEQEAKVGSLTRTR
jgi:excisionase family DNA binding protein